MAYSFRTNNYSPSAQLSLQKTNDLKKRKICNKIISLYVYLFTAKDSLILNIKVKLQSSVCHIKV